MTTAAPEALAGTDDATARCLRSSCPTAGSPRAPRPRRTRPEPSRGPGSRGAGEAHGDEQAVRADLPEGATAAQALAQRERAERKKDRHPVRSAGRFARFIVPILLILGLAVGVTAWYARRTYYVDFDRQRPASPIYQGRPGGLLLWDPTVVRRTHGHARTTSREDAQLDVEDRKEFADKGAAIAFVGRDRGTAPTTTTTHDHHHDSRRDDDARPR